MKTAQEARAFARARAFAQVHLEGRSPVEAPFASSVEGTPLLALAEPADGERVTIELGSGGSVCWLEGIVRRTKDPHALARLGAIHGEVGDGASLVELSKVRWRTEGGEESSATASEWSLGTPEWRDEEKGVLEHMNDDHVDSMERMCRFYRGIEVTNPSLVAVDPEGLLVRAGSDLLHFAFDAPAKTLHDVHMSTVALARRARTADA